MSNEDVLCWKSEKRAFVVEDEVVQRGSSFAFSPVAKKMELGEGLFNNNLFTLLTFV